MTLHVAHSPVIWRQFPDLCLVCGSPRRPPRMADAMARGSPTCRSPTGSFDYGVKGGPAEAAPGPGARHERN
jgi:hypothetical protein